MIELEDLKDMFEDIRSDSNWDVERPMLWGYFFIDSSPEKLERAAKELEQLGYRYVDIYLPDDDEDDVDEDRQDDDEGEGGAEHWFLHVEKEEIHTPESLHERNRQLYAFAEKHGLADYDGMDVGPVAQ